MGLLQSVGNWLLGLLSAMGIKLTSSVDDVVWLAPFLTTNSSVTARLQNSAVYIGICLIQTVIATVIASLGQRAVKWLTAGNQHCWSAEKILTVCAGILLALYSIKLVYEYIQEQKEEGEEEKEEETELAAQSVPLAGAGAKHLAPASAELGSMAGEHDAPRNGGETRAGNLTSGGLPRQEAGRRNTLICIAFIGSIDDLTLFVPMLVGRGFDVAQLTLGAFIAASAIVLLCTFIGMCKPVADCLSKIPLFVVVLFFSISLSVKGFLMDS